VEGWVNGALAEALRWHRGLRIHEKKALVAIVLSHLARGGKIENLNIPRAWLRRKGAELAFKTRKSGTVPPSAQGSEDRLPIVPLEESAEASEVPF
jgi:hypothetical protein